MINTLVLITEFVSNFGMLLAFSFMICCGMVSIGIALVVFAIQAASPTLKEAAQRQSDQEKKEAQNDPEFLEVYRIYKKNKN